MAFSKNHYLYIIVIFLATSINSKVLSHTITYTKITENLLQISDSLKTKTYDELLDLISKNINDSLTLRVYAEAILKRGRKEKDTSKIADGFYFLASGTINEDKILTYADSIIDITRNYRHRSHPACAYLLKADSFFRKRNFKGAFDNYILALNLSKNKNNYIYYYAKHFIGLLKSRVGKNKEALDLFRECLKFKKSQSTNDSDYLMALFAMSDSQMRNKNYDSATYYNKKGHLSAKRIADYNMASYFSMNEGFNEFYKKNYRVAIDSLKKSLFAVFEKEDYPNMACSYYYLGKSNYAIGNEDKAIVYFKKVDSVFILLKDVHPEVRDGYTILIDYFKKQKDISNQLKYVEKLLAVDSVLNKNYKELISSLNKDFDTPLLLDEKNQLIHKLNNEQHANKKWLWFLFSALIILSIVFVVKIIKSKLQKIEFKKLITDLENKNTKDTTKANEKSAAISDHILKNLSKKLKDFETKKDFLNPDLNSNNLALELQTNVKYLSKSIKHIYDKNFIDYLNDLRVNYAINKIKTETTFRNYTIKAIAEECGFKNPNSFSRAFVKVTEIKPSIFIKNIEDITSNSRI